MDIVRFGNKPADGIDKKSLQKFCLGCTDCHGKCPVFLDIIAPFLLSFNSEWKTA